MCKTLSLQEFEYRWDVDGQIWTDEFCFYYYYDENDYLIQRDSDYYYYDDNYNIIEIYRGENYRESFDYDHNNKIEKRKFNNFHAKL